jgi:hypothetical protein
MVKKKLHQRTIYSLAMLVSLLHMQGAYAIPPSAFKGTSAPLKKKYKYNSLTLGEAALECGLIHNMLFFLNVESAYDKNGQRDWINDKLLHPTAKLGRILLPSPTGTLAVESTHPANFGKYASRQTVALIQNYAYDIRQNNPIDIEHLRETIFASLTSLKVNTQAEESVRAELGEAIQQMKGGTILEIQKNLKSLLLNKSPALQKAVKAVVPQKKGQISATQLETLKTGMLSALNGALNMQISQKRTKEEKAFKKLFREQTLDPLLQSVKESIEREPTSIYPAHTTEQLISSFFCLKFSIQDDMWEYMRDLYDNIVDKTKIPTKSEYWTEQEVRQLETKPGAYDIDEAFAIAESDMWTALTPYRPNTPLLSNGNTLRFYRDAIDRGIGVRHPEEKPFADCAEITLRHIANMLLYDHLNRAFDLSSIRKTAGTSPYFRKFEEFYAAQPPALANTGDMEIRSKWNEVVGDLNEEQDPDKIDYVLDGHNEINPGFINTVRVFKKIFGLTTINDAPRTNLKDKKTWLETGLQTIFTALNPMKLYRFGLDNHTTRHFVISS